MDPKEFDPVVFFGLHGKVNSALTTITLAKHG